MGSPTDEPERSSDEVQHTVTVDSFYMAKTELTQKEYVYNRMYGFGCSYRDLEDEARAWFPKYSLEQITLRQTAALGTKPAAANAIADRNTITAEYQSAVAFAYTMNL